MNIQSQGLMLKGIKLEMEFVDGYILDEITNECNNTFKKILGYQTSNIYDNSSEKILTVLFKRIGEIEYKIVLKSNCLNFYTNIEFNYDIEDIFYEIKSVITLFYDFVYKMQDCRFKIVNIAFSKCVNIPENEKKEYFGYQNAVAENGIGMYIKCVQNERFNVLFKSYFLNKRDDRNFINKIDKDLYRLYNISYK